MEYENQLEAEKLKIQQEAQENLTVKDRKLRLLKTIMNQSDVESLAGDSGRVTPASQVTTWFGAAVDEGLGDGVSLLNAFTTVSHYASYICCFKNLWLGIIL